MLLTWTNTVPRRLVDQYTGEEVSRYFPELRYPHRSMKEQQAAAVVSTRGSVPAAAPKAQRQSVPQVARRAPEAAPTTKPASHRYIQVGTFSTPAKAQAAIRRVQAAGLPVRVKQIARAGAAHQMVVVGPFARQDRLSAALETVRQRIGYRAARLQN